MPSRYHLLLDGKARIFPIRTSLVAAALRRSRNRQKSKNGRTKHVFENKKTNSISQRTRLGVWNNVFGIVLPETIRIIITRAVNFIIQALLQYYIRAPKNHQRLAYTTDVYRNNNSNNSVCSREESLLVSTQTPRNST